MELPHGGKLLEHAAFSGDSKYLITASDDGSAKVWALDGCQLAEPQPRELRHGASVSIVALTTDGKAALTASNRPAHIGRRAGAERRRATRLHADGPGRPPDDTHAAALFVDKEASVFVKVWALSDPRADASPLPLGIAATRLQLAQGGRFLAYAPGSTAEVWDVGSLKPRRVPLPPQAPGTPRALKLATLSRDGLRVALVPDQQTYVDVLSLDSGDAGPVRFWSTVHTNALRSVQFSDDGRRVVSAAFDGSAVVWFLNEARAAPEPTRDPWVLTRSAGDQAPVLADGGRHIALRADDGGLFVARSDGLTAPLTLRRAGGAAISRLA